MYRGKQIYKVQGELCVPCNALHLSGEPCKTDPDFGEIPAEPEDTNPEYPYFLEEGDPVNLETDTEKKQNLANHIDTKTREQDLLGSQIQ